MKAVIFIPIVTALITIVMIACSKTANASNVNSNKVVIERPL
ncbi:hypothetical protein [Phocaeicola paurosaccharolyticus]|jgi:hypothetical protein|nr:hypothetical protein [Phocaeicola paurosaccharolyticus]